MRGPGDATIIRRDRGRGRDEEKEEEGGAAREKEENHGRRTGPQAQQVLPEQFLALQFLEQPELVVPVELLQQPLVLEFLVELVVVEQQLQLLVFVLLLFLVEQLLVVQQLPADVEFVVQQFLRGSGTWAGSRSSSSATSSLRATW